MTVYERVFYSDCVLMYRILNGMAPDYLLDMFTFQQEHDRYELRSSTHAQVRLNPPRAYKQCFEKSFMFAGAKTWNRLPNSVQEAPTLQCFKKLLKEYVFSNNLF